MKSLAELQEIRERVFADVNLRQEQENAIKIIVGMGECGIAAGARDVLHAFVRIINEKKLENVVVLQSDCMGLCRVEPTVSVCVPGSREVTYINMTADKAEKVVCEHIIKNQPVCEYLADA